MSTPLFSEKSVHRVVIIGGGFGGLFAAQHLKKAPVDIHLIDRRNFHLFQPLLYQVATGSLSPGNIATPLRIVLKHQKNVLVSMGEMMGLDPIAKEVILRDAVVPYDTLILAAGSESHYFGHEEWRAHAIGLKSVEDALHMRSRILQAFEAAERETDPGKIEELLTFVVVGAGPTGVELAGALAETATKTLRNDFRRIRADHAKIFLVNYDPRVLATYSPGLSAKAEKALKKLGVIVRNNLPVTDVREDGVIVGRAPDSERIPSRTVLWAAGVKPSSLGKIISKATGTNLDPQGRVPVNPDFTLPSHPDIFVVGDMAAARDTNDKPLPGVAPVAMQGGRYVAEAIKTRLNGGKVLPFRYHHRGTLATVGRNAAVAELGPFRFSGFLAWIIWIVVHLYYIVEFEDRLLVMMQWAWNYVTWSRSDLLITYPGNASERHQDHK